MKYSQEFLKQLDQQKNKIIYARIIALDLNDLPLQQIEGHITQGSINIDGASAVRRTCSLTIVAREDKFKFSDYSNWGYNTKFKLEIGIENTIDSNYLDIIWFPQGIFIITSFSSSRSTNSLNITIQGKDKMCLLNGEVGGNLAFKANFGDITEIDQEGRTITRKLTITEIIKDIVVYHGKEREENVIINDLDAYGLELLEYRGNSPLYLFRQGEGSTDTFLTATYQGDIKCKLQTPESNDNKNNNQVLLKNLEDNQWGYTYDTITEGLLGKSKNIANIINFSDSAKSDFDIPYHIVRIKYGQTIGFNSTELVFAGELQANAGETLTSVLDKIKNMLGEFEYFYDVNGHFIFQQKPSVYRRNWGSSYAVKNGVVEDKGKNKQNFLEKLEQSKVSVYHLNGTELVTAFNNTPTIGNIKNDFSIWGQRDSITGGNISIHLRCAIDKKPQSYVSIEVAEDEPEFIAYREKYNLDLWGQKSIPFIAKTNTELVIAGNNIAAVYCDWREIIFRMASDYLKYGFLSDFKQRIAKANKDYELYQNGITGYEQYYEDIWGYWRQLYNPNYLEFKNKDLSYWLNGRSYNTIIEGKITDKENYYLPRKNQNNIAINPQFDYWSKSVVEAPETLNFWFDFIDTKGELEQYSIDAIGRRTKTINDTNIKAIFYEDTPTIIFVDDINNYQAVSSGDYSYIQVPKKLDLFSISTRGQSAMDKLDSLLYQHTYCTENASITTLPIYHLQPNTRIHIEDSVLGVCGDYIATKFSIQLAHGGTMAITATKANDKLNYY